MKNTAVLVVVTPQPMQNQAKYIGVRQPRGIMFWYFKLSDNSRPSRNDVIHIIFVSWRSAALSKPHKAK